MKFEENWPRGYKGKKVQMCGRQTASDHNSTFNKISRNVFNLQSRHEYMIEMAMFNVSKGNNSKSKPELRFMCSACRPIVLYICVKFRQNISNGIRVMERTQMMEVLTDGRMLKISDGIT